jgi:hypothetical protein
VRSRHDEACSAFLYFTDPTSCICTKNWSNSNFFCFMKKKLHISKKKNWSSSNFSETWSRGDTGALPVGQISPFRSCYSTLESSRERRFDPKPNSPSLLVKGGGGEMPAQQVFILGVALGCLTILGVMPGGCCWVLLASTGGC